MSLYLGNNQISGLQSNIEPTRNIGQIIQSITPLTDAGLHLLDGALITGDGIYSDFVTYMATLSGSHPECFTTEANWQSVVSSKGACGKFVYTAASGNTAASIRLPKITGFIEGTIDSNALGELVNAGLPNITGEFVFADNIVKNDSSAPYMNRATGCFSPASITANTCAIGGVTVTSVKSNNRQLIMNASRSSSIYGNSNTVQPQSIKVYYYIVLATTTKTEIEVDIDEVSSDLNALTGQMSNLNTLVQQMSVVFNNLYPLYSVYLSIRNDGVCPIAALIPGSVWELVSQDRALWGGNGTNANTWIAAGLPNITGDFNRQCFVNYSGGTDNGALYTGSANSPQTAGGTSGGCPYTVSIDASRSSSIYGNSSTVQPPAYRVNVWVRTA